MQATCYKITNFISINKLDCLECTHKACKIYRRNAQFSTVALGMKQYLMNATLSASTFGDGRVNCNIKLFLMILKMVMSWDSIVGIATCWTVLGSNPSGGQDFLHQSRPSLGPTQPFIQQVPGHSWG